MIKRTLLAALFGALFLTANTINAQKANIGINVAGAFPMGDMTNNFDFGIGGDVSFDYYFNDLFNIGIEAGYKRFNYDIDALDGEGLNIIPIQLTAGIHGDIDDWIDIYGELGGGLFLTSSTLENSSSRTDAGISPGVGVAFELTPTLFLDVNANYTMVFSEEISNNIQDFPNMQWIGVNVGLLYTIQEW